MNTIELKGNLNRSNKFFKDFDIQIISGIPSSMRIKHAIFDHDGTISTLRCGWEKIMESMMIKAILGGINKTSIDNNLYKKIKDTVTNYINISTGIQTILQMESLVKMVNEFGFVKKEEVLDKFGYKKIYNKEILRLVNSRVSDLEASKTDKNYFIIRGAINFINLLKEKGVKLYLVSGTDQEDVRNEARILDYNDLFDGGIFGSLNDIKKFSKKMVIENVLKENGLKGEELMVVGDGPVEIKEIREVNGVAIGVASDEINMKGINPIKKDRLITSGANIIIPDFSRADLIIDFLFND